MRLLKELMTLQYQRGFIDDAALRDLSSRESVPLYRLEGLVSFYPHFRRTAPPATAVHVCRDVVCAMHGCGALTAELRSRLQDNGNIEIHEVSCRRRRYTSPAVSLNDIPLPQETVSYIEALLVRTTAPDKRIDDEKQNAVVADMLFQGVYEKRSPPVGNAFSTLDEGRAAASGPHRFQRRNGHAGDF